MNAITIPHEFQTHAIETREAANRCSFVKKAEAPALSPTRDGDRRPAALGRRGRGRGAFAEQFGEFFRHGAAQLLGVDDRHRAPVIAGDVMADADGDEFDR